VKIIYKIILILLIASSVRAGGFDDLGNSARVFSLGGAYTAVADAPYSIFYNPSGIYRLNKFSISEEESIKIFNSSNKLSTSFLYLSNNETSEVLNAFISSLCEI